jgi:hypothetical protein
MPTRTVVRAVVVGVVVCAAVVGVVVAGAVEEVEFEQPGTRATTASIDRQTSKILQDIKPFLRILLLNILIFWANVTRDALGDAFK